MSKIDRLKEDVNNLRGVLVAMFSVLMLVLYKKFDGMFSISIAVIAVFIGIIAYYNMNKKLDEIEEIN